MQRGNDLLEWWLQPLNDYSVMSSHALSWLLATTSGHVDTGHSIFHNQAEKLVYGTKECGAEGRYPTCCHVLKAMTQSCKECLRKLPDEYYMDQETSYIERYTFARQTLINSWTVLYVMRFIRNDWNIINRIGYILVINQQRIVWKQWYMSKSIYNSVTSSEGQSVPMPPRWLRLWGLSRPEGCCRTQTLRWEGFSDIWEVLYYGAV